MSASCTHVSALLHTLAALNSSTFQLNPNLPSIGDPEEEQTPVTSLPCQWKPPKARKDSMLPISSTSPDYQKPNKQPINSLEDFDPRPPKFRGKIKDRISTFWRRSEGRS